MPNPSYPIHIYGPVIFGRRHPRTCQCARGVDFFDELQRAIKDSYPKPKMLILNFPSNPTTQCVELAFFERVVELAREHHIYVVHDLAYADIVFDGYHAPSILQVPGAREVAVEFFTLSKSYNMPGWRVGFMVGNRELVAALGRIKSYLDYGTFTPIQVASIVALEGPQDCVRQICADLPEPARRAVQGPAAGRLEHVEVPKATMFVWAQIPEPYRKRWVRSSSRRSCSTTRKVAVSPGVGFGEYGDDHVRFSLIENEDRTRQALRGIKEMFKKDGLL